MTTFVKQGKQGQLSYVEIDLLRDDNSFVTVRRAINSETKESMWSVDGKPSKLKHVLSIMADLAIDVDNLCSFMPQDRVGEFSRNTAKETLQKTLQSIIHDDEKTLADEQSELANLEKSRAEQAKDAASKQSAYDTMVQQMAGMKAEVDRMEARRSAQDKLKLCEIKHTVQVVKNGAERVKVLQDEVNNAGVALAEAQNAVQPLELKERELKKRQAGHDKTFDQAKQKLDAGQKKVNQAKENLDGLGDNVNAAEEELKYVEVIRKKHEGELSKCEADIAKNEKSLATLLANMPEVKEKLSTIVTRLEELDQVEGDLGDEVSLLVDARHKCDHAVSVLNNNLKGLKDPGQVFRTKLDHMAKTHNNPRARTAAAHAIRALDWVNAQRREANGHKFQKEILGPVAACIKVTDPAVAVMVDQVVGGPFALLTFIAQTKEDGQYMRDQVSGGDSGRGVSEMQGSCCSCAQ